LRSTTACTGVKFYCRSENCPIHYSLCSSFDW